MRARWLVGILLAAVLLGGPAGASAADGDSMVRVKSGLDGLGVVSAVCRLLGCQNLGALDVLPGQTSGGSLFLVRNLPVVTPALNLLLSVLGVASVEADLPVLLGTGEGWASQQASAAVLDQLWDRTPTTYYGASAWRSYLTQPANGIIRLAEAHCTQSTTGSGIVAVIDTGVDGTHPILQPVMVPGWDFTAGALDAGEPWTGQQASASVLDGVAWVNPSTAASVDQASAAVLDDGSHVAYGHGTMVAGTVHLAAPTAKIMPLKAFTADGHGSTSDIVHAIYFATLKGAKVLNMSFSRTTPSAELKLALDVASARGLIAVSSAGNQGTSALTYPAAYANVIGVASTANDDTRSSFSNYGSSVVWVAAPGEGIVTTYPGGRYAAAWGTSFSTPYVAGTAALLATLSRNVTGDQAAAAVAHARLLTPSLNKGRLDVVQAVAAGRAMFPDGGSDPVPASCGTDAADWSVP